MPRLDEFFAVLTEDPEGPVELAGKTYMFASMAVRNPDQNSEDLRLLPELAHEHVKQDGRNRILVRYRGKRLKSMVDEVELISTIPIGPVEEVLKKI